MKNNNNNNNLGFSLIELIVVITIMAVVTAVVAVSYRGANEKARDNRRVADLEKVRVALELYKQTNGDYPAGDIFGPSSPLVPNYLQSMPGDPKGFTYYYLYTGPYNYQLSAHLEVGATGSYGSNCSGLCNYQVTNQ